MRGDPWAAGLRPVALAPKSLAEYAPLVGDNLIAEIEMLARPLRGARVAHVSATAQGGGVAEILQTLVPLMRSAGLQAEWHVMTGSATFFTISKRLHNALQGSDLTLTEAMKATYVATNAQDATSFADDFDFVVVHDPQPAPLRGLCAHGTWIWQCHIDLTSAQPSVWQFLRSFVDAYDAAVFTMAAFAKPDLRLPTIAFIPPAIDPLSPKNVFLPADEVATAVAKAGLDPSRPMLLQVSRFDPWKDPLGVIDVFRAVRPQAQGLQLAMLGAPVRDDPEGATYFQRAKAYARDDPDIHLLANTGGSSEVNAFQRHAAVILQKSLREGFGLTVTEALWKYRPVVAGNVGGIPLQIEDGVTGYLAASTERCVERVLEVLHSPHVASRLGQNGHDVVRRNFLCTANLRNYLQLFRQLDEHASASADAAPRSPDEHPTV